MCLTLQTLAEKTDHGEEIHRLFGKEDVSSTAVIKEGHVDSLFGQERTHH